MKKAIIIMSLCIAVLISGCQKEELPAAE